MKAQINGTDITKYIQESTYIMYADAITDSWEDANHVEHTSIIRKQITGSFDLAFTDDTSFNAFLSLVNANTDTSTGRLAIQVYVSNTNSMENIETLFVLQTKKDITISSDRFLKIFSVKIKDK